MSNLLDKPADIPSSAGIYIFKTARGTPLYIGKAGNLKNRTASYFRKNVSQKVVRLRKEAKKLEWRELASDVEALIEEARLIKQHTPKYNVLMRDDKNYVYVAITREVFPHIFVTHQFNQTKHKHTSYLGPFTSSSALKTTLRLLRTLFPYCTCSRPHTRRCVNAQIGRCPGFCCTTRTTPTTGQTKEYKKNVQNIVAVLEGKKKRLLSQLKKDMRAASKKQEYEKAATLRDQIEGIENIFAHHHVRPDLQNRNANEWTKTQKTLQMLLKINRSIHRAEAYDISNISGTAATGSMVVFINGTPAPSEYRVFNIKTVQGISDVDMHKEVMARRLRHPEWKYPDLIVIDGGKPQLNAAISGIEKFRILNFEFRLPYITALAKKQEELYIHGHERPLFLSTLPAHTERFFKHLRDESHRFAKKQHHKLRRKEIQI